MSGKTPWRIAVLYGGAILLGIAFGLFASRLAGGLWYASRGPAVAQAAEPEPAAVTVPGSPDATYICTPSYIGAFSNRVHVRCTIAAPNGIYYFAAPTSEFKERRPDIKHNDDCQVIGQEPADLLRHQRHWCLVWLPNR